MHPSLRGSEHGAWRCAPVVCGGVPPAPLGTGSAPPFRIRKSEMSFMNEGVKAGGLLQQVFRLVEFGPVRGAFAELLMEESLLHVAGFGESLRRNRCEMKEPAGREAVRQYKTKRARRDASATESGQEAERPFTREGVDSATLTTSRYTGEKRTEGP